MLWGYIYFPQLQLDSLLTAQESDLALSNESNVGPIAIVDAKQNRVVQRNAAAKQLGITLNMGLATAASLSHELKILPYQDAIEKQELVYIVECLYDLVSDMAFDPPNGVFIRFGNMLKLYRDLKGLASQLVMRLDNLLFSYCYASAYSPLAAKVLARSGYNKFLNDERAIEQALHALSVEQVFLKEAEQLTRLGVKTLSQLMALPFAELNKRLAPSLLQKILQLQGKASLPLTFYLPKPKFTHEIELFYEVSSVSVLIKPISHVLKKLAHFLHIRALASQTLTVHCRYRSGESFSFEVHSGELCDSAEKWQRLITLKLTHIKLSEPVVAVGIFCLQLALKTVQHQDFFNQKHGQLSPLELISLLQAKLSQSSVKQPVVRSEHIPETASTLVKVMAQTTQQMPANMALSDDIYLRPSYMLAEPEPLNVQVSIVHGPERIETAWWQKTVVRDYFIARNAQGQWCWIFRNHQHQWFIHGYFG